MTPIGSVVDWKKGAFPPEFPSRKNRKEPIPHDAERYKSRHKIEVMSGRLKDWRRVAKRYDRSPVVFRSAIALAALVICWLCVLSLGCKTPAEVFTEKTLDQAV